MNFKLNYCGRKWALIFSFLLSILQEKFYLQWQRAQFSSKTSSETTRNFRQGFGSCGLTTVFGSNITKLIAFGNQTSIWLISIRVSQYLEVYTMHRQLTSDFFFFEPKNCFCDRILMNCQYPKNPSLLLKYFIFFSYTTTLVLRFSQSVVLPKVCECF